MLEKIEQTYKFLNEKTNNFAPDFGMVLGTGLGGIVEHIDVKYSIDYQDIVNFPLSTVESHKGKLIFGFLSGKKVVAMQGRFHYYEGHSFQAIAFPIRVMKFLGIKFLILSNACGSVNPNIKTGNLMIIEDHINLLGGNPLRGKNIDKLGPRFPDMSQPYKKEYIKKALDIAKKQKIDIHTGVFASVEGPNLETRAEYKYLQIIGADVVGMSTVPEAITAKHMDLPCFAISAITDEGFHEQLEPVSLQDVIDAAKIAEPKMIAIIRELIKEI